MSNQSDKQQSIRDVTGTALTYNGDWLALFDSLSIDGSSFDGRMLNYINTQLGSNYTNLPSAMQAFAEDQGYDNWDSMGTFTPSGVSIPFLYDADTYWLDFEYDQNIQETTGVTTVSKLIERITGETYLRQLVKDQQPLAVTNGVDFNKDSNRQMTINNTAGITNGSDGWYIALNCMVVSGDSNIMSIARNASSTASRGQIYVTGSRNFAVKAANNDGGTINFVGYGPAITLSQWYTLEMRWTCDPNTLEIWHDGVAQTLASGPTGTFNAAFPATNPSEICVGNFSSTDLDSFDGTIQQIIFHDGVPSDAIRESISAYLIGEKP